MFKLPNVKLDGMCGAGFSPRCRLPGAALLLALAALFATAAQAAPFVPASDAEILETLPEASDSAGRALRRMHGELAADPHNAALAIAVARADLDRGRTLADPRYLGRAEAALAAWPDTAAAPPGILLLRAVLRQSTHDFTGARAELGRVLKLEPRSPQAWLTRASIETVEAAYPAALADCGQFALLDIGLAPVACTASVIGVTGHARLALGALNAALRDAATEPVAVRLWAETLRGEIAARLGDAAQAEAAFTAAMQLVPEDAYLLGAYSDFLLDQQRPAEVRSLLKPYFRADPLLLRLTLAEAALGAEETGAHIAELAARFATARLRGDTVHRREEARFTLALLHRPQEALALAQANWLVQRELADARILLEAAVAAGTPDEAVPATAWALANHVEDVALARLLPATRQHAAN